jgi:hypothetical protein
LPSAPAKKSFSSVSSPISAQTKFVAGVKCFDIDCGRRRIGFRFSAKDTGSPFKQLILPLPNLVGMHIELLSQRRQRPFASHRGKRHLRLESRAVVQRDRFVIVSPVRGYHAGLRQKSTYSWRSNFPSHLSSKDDGSQTTHAGCDRTG